MKNARRLRRPDHEKRRSSGGRRKVLNNQPPRTFPVPTRRSARRLLGLSSGTAARSLPAHRPSVPGNIIPRVASARSPDCQHLPKPANEVDNGRRTQLTTCCELGYQSDKAIITSTIRSRERVRALQGRTKPTPLQPEQSSSARANRWIAHNTFSQQPKTASTFHVLTLRGAKSSTTTKPAVRVRCGGPVSIIRP